VPCEGDIESKKDMKKLLSIIAVCLVAILVGATSAHADPQGTTRTQGAADDQGTEQTGLRGEAKEADSSEIRPESQDAAEAYENVQEMKPIERDDDEMLEETPGFADGPENAQVTSGTLAIEGFANSEDAEEVANPNYGFGEDLFDPAGSAQEDGWEYCTSDNEITITNLGELEGHLNRRENWKDGTVMCFNFPEAVPVGIRTKTDQSGNSYDVDTLVLPPEGVDLENNAHVVIHGVKLKAGNNLPIEKPLVRIRDSVIKLKLVDWQVSNLRATTNERGDCISIAGTEANPDAVIVESLVENVSIARSKIAGCRVGVHVKKAKNVLLGAREASLYGADKNEFKNNRLHDIEIESGKRIRHGYNLFDLRADMTADEISDVVDLAPAANDNILPPLPAPVGEAGLYFILMTDGAGNQRELHVSFPSMAGERDDGPGQHSNIQFYSISGGAINFVGTCRVDGDGMCKARLASDWKCTDDMEITAVNTQRGSSELMDLLPCDFERDVLPTEEVVIATPAPTAEEVEVDLALEGSAAMAGAPAKKMMCSLSVNATASDPSLIWLFLSIGILGSMRFLRRK